MVDVIPLERRLGDRVCDTVDRWMRNRMTARIVCEVVTAIA